MVKTKRFVKQFALIILSMMMLFSSNINANAATADDYGIQPMYTTITTNSAYIRISGIKATMPQYHHNIQHH